MIWFPLVLPHWSTSPYKFCSTGSFFRGNFSAARKFPPPRVTHNYSLLFHVGGLLSRGAQRVGGGNCLWGLSPKSHFHGSAGGKLILVRKLVARDGKTYAKRQTHTHTVFFWRGENFTGVGCRGKAWKEKFLHTKSRFGFTGVFTNFTEQTRRKRPLGSTTALRMKILARFGDVLSPILLGKFRRLSGKATTEHRWR